MSQQLSAANSKSSISNFLSLVKFSHTIFAMPFALIGFFLATEHYGYDFSWMLLVLVVLCMIFARNAAMAFNRYIDRDIDEENPRTAIREIPSGSISPKSAASFVLINCILFVVTTAFINPLCLALSPIALAVVLGYSYTKRFTSFCHLVLGLGLGLAPVGAFLAVSQEFFIEPVLLGFAVLFWVSGFDIIYALQDEDFDKEKKLFSIPVWLGKKGALHLSEILHFLSFIFLALLGFTAGFGAWYWIGNLLFGALLIYQHSLVSSTDLSKVNLAFFTTNGIASMAFAFFVLLELFR